MLVATFQICLRTFQTFHNKSKKLKCETLSFEIQEVFTGLCGNFNRVNRADRNAACAEGRVRNVASDCTTFTHHTVNLQTLIQHSGITAWMDFSLQQAAKFCQNLQLVGTHPDWCATDRVTRWKYQLRCEVQTSDNLEALSLLIS